MRFNVAFFDSDISSFMIPNRIPTCFTEAKQVDRVKTQRGIVRVNASFVFLLRAQKTFIFSFFLFRHSYLLLLINANFKTTFVIFIIHLIATNIEK